MFDDDPSQHCSLLANLLSPTWYHTVVHRKGFIVLENGTSIAIPGALFDSGALGANYMSKTFVDDHSAQLSHLLEPCSGSVKLASAGHAMPITQSITLSITFSSSTNTNTSYTATLKLYVLTGLLSPIIIGLPAILNHYTPLFIEMIQAASDSITYSASASYLCNTLSPDLIPPWSASSFLDEAPEDLETPLPVCFGDALHYMEKPYEDALQDYFDLIPTQVSPEFSATTSIVDLLRSSLAIDVFVPQNWKGVKDIVIELNWKADLPSRLKPHARPINPRLFAHAKAEFDRLCKYFYQPSTSPIASCLVIAPKTTTPFIRYCGDYVTLNRYIEIGHYPIPVVLHELEKISGYSHFLDLDLVNSFHQFRLGPITSRRLSIVTPWGQVEPLFLPEGVGPASFILQEAMQTIFGDFDSWTVVIFDNILILGTSFQDLFEKDTHSLQRVQPIFKIFEIMVWFPQCEILWLHM